MSQIINATDASFETDVTNSDIPVLVDFWAPWCGPCKTMSPILAQLAEEFDGIAKIVKVDVDENFATASKFNIRNVPTLMVVSGGQVKATRAGAVTKLVLAEFINKNI